MAMLNWWLQSLNPNSKHTQYSRAPLLGEAEGGYNLGMGDKEQQVLRVHENEARRLLDEQS